MKFKGKNWRSFSLAGLFKLFHRHDGHKSLQFVKIKPLSAINRCEYLGDLFLKEKSCGSELNVNHSFGVLDDGSSGKTKLD